MERLVRPTDMSSRQGFSGGRLPRRPRATGDFVLKRRPLRAGILHPKVDEGHLKALTGQHNIERKSRRKSTMLRSVISSLGGHHHPLGNVHQRWHEIREISDLTSLGLGKIQQYFIGARHISDITGSTLV